MPVISSTTIPARPTAVVVGGGTMGAGITHSLLVSGAVVHLAEENAVAAEAALIRVRASLGRQAAGDSRLLTECGDRLTAAVGLPAISGVDIVIEAIPEYVELKRDVVAAAQARYPDVLVATNTSSLPIDRIADAMRDPGRLVGMHFFNPVPSSQLIEIVVGLRTSEQAIGQARAWADFIGKTSIVVRDSPGFATSRLGLAIGLEAIRMVSEGVASVPDIDLGMTLGYKFPVGPLELTDRVGLDVRLAIATHLSSTLGERFQAPDLLRQMVAEGKLGRKSGEGFYLWGQDGRKRPPAAEPV
ncbi:MAG TPA: 3-hydroxyacyl-CoA dehydrogenase family protein [Jatrophihabitantaceae bacterium]|nr:3-hydroxyacyl-CoA dehydrogenase family protein [Jatrophihabitantaceae bacterium]